MFNNVRKNCFVEGHESVSLAKEAGDMDQDVTVKLIELFGGALDQEQIIFQSVDLAQNHPALDTALERGLLVVGEINALGLAKHPEKRVDVSRRPRSANRIEA